MTGNGSRPAFWKGVVYGLLAPVVVGGIVTVFATIVVLVTNRRQIGEGGS